MSDVASKTEQEDWDSDEKSWEKQIDEQFSLLPPTLLRLDRGVVKATEWTVVLTGSVFTCLIVFDVASRYIFGVSSFFVSGAAKFLLFWFFLLGAGLALRQGSHVGFEMLVNSFRPRPRRSIKFITRLLVLVFFLEMLWGGLSMLGPAMGEVDPALDVSLFWGFLAIPVGFALLIYHLLILMILDGRPAAHAETDR